ncbi:hypothetical protein Vretimale_15251 [Volvox reticuliferus]|uniref:Uncharacterized protein n=1 Tax=Volvox reticuliferus TaxID=1737510 RepID=A0A8J4C6L6_9CHLO|nr:hypothetical protein Vretifemale_5442 [Volvox reticuliferus]GIM11786.1 hypothetical protein Vretimale_15251 [Volvox reticuliferus]
MPRADITASQASRIRCYLLGSSPDASVARELWSCGRGATYSAYRECIQQRKQVAAVAAQRAAFPGAARGGGGGGTGALLPRAAANLQSLPATVKYSFEGVKHVLAEASSSVTALCFAALRNDLMAFGCLDGELWRVILPPPAASAQAQPTCTKARKMHCGAVTAVDWAFDNSQLLSVGDDGSLCVWDPADPSFPCIRSVCAPTTSFLCGRFHRVNFSLAMVGTSAGAVEVLNCSTGMLHSRYQVTSAGSGVQVTALDSSNHHVFLGDSVGILHWFTCELHGRQLSRLKHAGKLRLATGGGGSGAGGGGHAGVGVTALQYVPFCRTTDTPVLMVAQQDGSLCIVRANEVRHTADLYLRRVVTPAAGPALSSTAIASSGSSSASRSRAGGAGPATLTATAAAATVTTTATALLRFCPAVCPLSVIQDVPLITYGSDDTAVYIVDVTARSFCGPVGGSRGGGGGGGTVAGAPLSERPMTVTVLKAHRAAVTAVAWTYDEALLASADAEGTVVLWRRSRLF